MRMLNKRQQNRFFRKLVLVSLLVHSSVLVGFLMVEKPEDGSSQPRMVQIQLREQSVSQEDAKPEQKTETSRQEEAEEEQEQIANETHLPTHNADEVGSNNQNKDVEGKIVAGGGTGAEDLSLAKADLSISTEQDAQPEKESDVLNKNNQQANSREVVATTGLGRTQSLSQSDTSGETDQQTQESSQAAAVSSSDFLFDVTPKDQELRIPREFLDGYGNLELLSDGELSNALVEQPFSENESKELQLVNRYLERMSMQVRGFWVNPYRGARQLRGIIKLELSTDGYLENAFIYRSSGHSLLDVSVLDAIRAVPRYEVPENEIITARYYTNLSFHYSSIEEETELMPFEESGEQVN